MPKLKTDEELLKHLEEKAPEVLSAINFDALVGKIIPVAPENLGLKSKKPASRGRRRKAPNRSRG
jgi:hypothetical protein